MPSLAKQKKFHSETQARRHLSNKIKKLKNPDSVVKTSEAVRRPTDDCSAYEWLASHDDPAEVIFSAWDGGGGVRLQNSSGASFAGVPVAKPVKGDLGLSPLIAKLPFCLPNSFTSLASRRASTSIRARQL